MEGRRLGFAGTAPATGSPLAPAVAVPISPASGFVAIALLLGIALAVVSPPLRWGDENTHLLQAYALSEGRLLPEVRDGVVGIDVPRAVQRFILVYAVWWHARKPGVPSWAQVVGTQNIRLDGERSFAPLAAFTYGVIGYAPQALGIALARQFTDSVLLHLYAARIANLVCWALLIWLALRTTPYLKLVLCVVALAPMSVYLAGSCSADGMSNGLAFLWFACVLRLAAGSQSGTMTRARWVALGGLAAAMSVTKLLYTPLLLLLLLLPPARLGGSRRLLAVTAAVLGAGVLAVASFVLLSRDLLFRMLNHRGDSAAAKNLTRLIEDPGGVLALIGTTTWTMGGRWLWQIADTNWKGIMPPEWLFWLWLTALVAAFLAEARPAGWPSPRQRFVALVAPVLAWTGIALAAFLFWTKGPRETVAGLQGRYLIPLVPPLLLAITPPSLRIRPGARALLVIAALALCTWVLLHTIERTTRMY